MCLYLVYQTLTVIFIVVIKNVIYSTKQIFVCSIMLEQPIEILLVKIELMSKTLSCYVTPTSDMQSIVAHYTKKCY